MMESPKRPLVLRVVIRAVRLAVLLVFAMVTVLPFTLLIANTLRPRMPTRRNPGAIGLKYESIKLTSADGTVLDAWWIPGAAGGTRTMLVCHGVGANRDDILRFLPFLHDAGYHILTWDWRGHGLSDWRQVTFGLNEKKDVRAAVDWVLKERGPQAQWLGGFGISMGAGILVQAGPSCPEVKAFVLDSPFASVRTMLPFMLKELPALVRTVAVEMTGVAAYLVVGTSIEGVAPVSYIGQIAPRPIFMSHGTADKVIPWEETRRLEAACRGPVEVWIEDGIQHTELREYQPARYHARVLAFLEKAASAAR